jgi:hypothetical protein
MADAQVMVDGKLRGRLMQIFREGQFLGEDVAYVQDLITRTSYLGQAVAIGQTKGKLDQPPPAVREQPLEARDRAAIKKWLEPFGREAV